MHDHVRHIAKCYWPGATEPEVTRAVGRLTSEVYRGAIFFPADELLLCLFSGSSRVAIQRTVTRAGIPSERVMESVWLPARGETPR